MSVDKNDQDSSFLELEAIQQKNLQKDLQFIKHTVLLFFR